MSDVRRKIITRYGAVGVMYNGNLVGFIPMDKIDTCIVASEHSFNGAIFSNGRFLVQEPVGTFISIVENAQRCLNLECVLLGCFEASVTKRYYNKSKDTFLKLCLEVGDIRNFYKGNNARWTINSKLYFRVSLADGVFK